MRGSPFGKSCLSNREQFENRILKGSVTPAICWRNWRKEKGKEGEGWPNKVSNKVLNK